MHPQVQCQRSLLWLWTFVAFLTASSTTPHHTCSNSIIWSNTCMFVTFPKYCEWKKTFISSIDYHDDEVVRPQVAEHHGTTCCSDHGWHHIGNHRPHRYDLGLAFIISCTIAKIGKTSLLLFVLLLLHFAVVVLLLILWMAIILCILKSFIVI